MSYIVNGKTQVGWRIDKLADSEDDTQTLGMDWLKSYVAFVREKPVADQIVALLNEAEDTSPPAPTEDREALRAAALEEAAKLVEDADEGAHGQDYQLGDVAEFRHRVATEIRALAGSPAQQGQLGKEGVK